MPADTGMSFDDSVSQSYSSAFFKGAQSYLPLVAVRRIEDRTANPVRGLEDQACP